MNERLLNGKIHQPSRGTSRYVKVLKPEARRANTEEKAWEATEKILQARIENWPNGFIGCYSIVRRFHELRWDIKYDLLQIKMEKIKEFRLQYPPEIIQQAKDALGLISQILG